MREVVPRAVRLGTVTTKVSNGAQSLAPVLETGRKLGFTVEPSTSMIPPILRRL